jgi:hypothetical protein
MVRPKIFPTAEVSRILGLYPPTSGDTYVGRDFTLDELTELDAIGALDLEERQNDSPSIGQFLEFFRAFEHNGLSFIGYIIFPPRSDARISIEGFECHPTDAQKQLLQNHFGRADEFECKKGYCRAWWD